MPFPFSDIPDSAGIDSAHRVDTVLFDYGQVLSMPPDPAAWTRMVSISGLTEAQLHASYWKFRHDYDRGALGGSTYWQAVASDAGVGFSALQISKLEAADVDLWTVLNLPMVEWAEQLQRAGIRTGILSNIGDSIAAGIIAKFPWLSGFNQCIWSYALSMAKPEAAIFLRTAEALQTPPTRILFIDDREDNTAAAAALGMQTIQYTNHGEFLEEMQQRGFSSLLGAGQTSVDLSPASDVVPAATSAIK